MTAQHTPGPWEDPIKALGGEWHVNSPDGQLFVRVLGAPSEAVANARLIAAAPLMLEALREALADHSCDWNGCWHDKALTAIRAATGEDA